METLDKKALIEHVAFDLFLNIGYDATSIRTICKQAKIDPPTLYNYYGSKKGLFFAIANERLRDFMQESDLDSKLRSSLPPDMQLYSIFCSAVSFAVEHIDETKFLIRYRLFSPIGLVAEVEEFILKIYEVKRKLVSSILYDCIKTKLIAINAEQASKYFWKFVNSNSISVVFEDWRPSKDELLELWRYFYEVRLKGIMSAA